MLPHLCCITYPSEQYFIWISPSPAGSGSPGASCVFYGVFIAEEFDRAEDKGSGGTTGNIPLVNRILMTDLFVLSKHDLLTHYVFCCKSFDFVDTQNISCTHFKHICYYVRKPRKLLTCPMPPTSNKGWIKWLTDSFIHSFIHSLTHSFIHSSIHSLTLTHSFIHSSIHSFIHPFIHSYIHTDIPIGLFEHVSEICLCQQWSFLLVDSKTSGLGSTLLKCQIVRISRLSDTGLKELYCT